MTEPFLDDGDVKVYVGDCRQVLQGLPEKSVQCVVTSPPYWGLRDYGTGSWEGGDPDCQHNVGTQIRQTKNIGSGHEGNYPTGQRPGVDAYTCKKCGATRVDHQIGLEQTPEDYVADMVDVFRELHRVLRDDGVCWLNIGDSYAPDHAQSRSSTDHLNRSMNAGLHSFIPGSRATELRGTPPGLKPKDLVGIPWMVAFALRADGWWLRSDTIWAKPDPMPESVTDRPTRSHEYLFLLTKSRSYFYDHDAIREEYAPDNRKKRVHDHSVDGSHSNHAGMKDGKPRWAHSGRNKRSVWFVPTSSYEDAHFAVFPPKLIEPCIKAGTSEKGCCRVCGAPWVRVVERVSPEPEREGGDGNWHKQQYGRAGGFYDATSVTTDWVPSCPRTCPGFGREPVGCVVLDPFGGSGTTGRVSRSLGRRAVLIDLNPEYAELMRRGLQQLSLLA